MASQDYKSLNVSPETHERVLCFVMRHTLATGEKLSLKDVTEEALNLYLDSKRSAEESSRGA